MYVEQIIAEIMITHELMLTLYTRYYSQIGCRRTQELNSQQGVLIFILQAILFLFILPDE